MSDITADVNASLKRIEDYLNAQENEKALEELKGLGKEDMKPEDFILYTHLYGLTLSRFNKLDDAVSYFRRSRSAAEKQGDLRSAAREDELLGSIYHQRERLREANMHYSSALNIWTSLGDIEGQGRGHRDLGNLYVDGGDLRNASIEYEKSCEFFRQAGKFEEMAPAIMHRGAMAYQEKGLSAALGVYQKAIEEEKCTHYSVLNNYGFMLMLNNQPQDALAYLQRSLEVLKENHIIDDDLALTTLNIGIVCALLDKLDEAEKHLREAAEMLEKYPNAKVVELLLQANLKYGDKGFSKYLIVDNGQKRAVAHLNLAAVLAWKGRIEEAKAEAAKGVEADRNAGYPYLSAGWIYLEAGMAAEASSAFYRACSFEPKNEEFRKALNLVNPYANAKVGRNDPCPCGSGKKFKKCHGNV